MNEGKKRIVVIAPLPPPYGGIAFITKSLFDAGLNEKFEVLHLNTSRGSLTEKIGKLTFRSVYISFRNILKLIGLCFKEKNIQYALILGTNVTAIIRISVFVFICRTFHIKVITNLHGTRFYKDRKGLIKKLNDYVINKSEFILSPTKIDMDGIKPFFNKNDHIRLFYNSKYINEQFVDLNRIHSNNSSELKIIGIGRLSKAKGTYDLFDVCINLLQSKYCIKLVWIGRGAFENDDEYAENLISKLDKNFQNKIQVFKDVEEIEKYDLLRNSDIFVLPSYSDNLPISILEAMAFGLPVISSKTGAIPEVIVDKVNGWLIDVGDSKSLKELIIGIIDSRDQLIQIGKSNSILFQSTFSTINRLNELSSLIETKVNNTAVLD